MNIPDSTSSPVPILGLAHIGIHVHDLERSVAFYALLGFRKSAGPLGPEPVAILDHPAVSPLTMCRCANSNSRIAGMPDGIAPAAITPFLISYSCANLAIATGTVAVCRAVRLSATGNSFQLKMKTRMPAAASPGRTSG